MTTTPTQVDQSQQVRQRALQRTMQERRRRVIRSIVAFIVVTVVMVLLSMARRDQEAMRNSKQLFEYVRDTFQRTAVNGPLPPVLPMPESDSADVREVLRGNICYTPAVRSQLGPAHPQVAVCFRAVPLRLYLQASGRHVVLFDGERYNLVWMPESEVRRRAAELGIYLGPKP